MAPRQIDWSLRAISLAARLVADSPLVAPDLPVGQRIRGMLTSEFSLKRQRLRWRITVLLTAHVAVVLHRRFVQLQVTVRRNRGAPVAQRVHLLRGERGE